MTLKNIDPGRSRFYRIECGSAVDKSGDVMILDKSFFVDTGQKSGGNFAVVYRNQRQNLL